MKSPANYQLECTRLPILSSRNQGWENILVEQFQHPAGEGKTYYSEEHSICFSLAPRPVHLLQTQGDKTRTGLYAKGDFCLTPAKMPFFARWDSEDRFLQIRITSQFIQSVAGETIDTNPDHLELLPEFRTRDPQIEAISMLLLVELKQENLGGKLYIDSLANVLAVHLLRQYAATKPHLRVYAGGLPQRQLLQVLDYINDHLNQDIKLADLAALLDMSQFHFSHLFKQSLGTSPYQYLLQQRIERAKQLLKHSDRAIIDIAFLCGFNSHSHLSKQFRQLTGMTPKDYRALK
ncbi:helix-turn-helix domain-containing protein [Gloeocapsopsis dulcis]|uniref:AraC family transcriptional regulator n=1 Tax=Gloeocapsopsis dulcis AAB1 = 1H9 TaxID=1433147 RepID=A0A6N8G1Y1_9CHRO|nr:AraC family transcriptional regulator [Gloeocapsopsis dulcis]MUL39410.1 AraC family transcriptional regulator [Gloeocapsopsis dulcis AAB1 = 1H9]WNN89279.1 AraC family transcriptional regulator [Gloeocapsopsis dulcis]